MAGNIPFPYFKKKKLIISDVSKIPHTTKNGTMHYCIIEASTRSFENRMIKNIKQMLLSRKC